LGHLRGDPIAPAFAQQAEDSELNLVGGDPQQNEIGDG
jgi:hypothetical protein